MLIYAILPRMWNPHDPDEHAKEPPSWLSRLGVGMPLVGVVVFVLWLIT